MNETKNESPKIYQTIVNVMRKVNAVPKSSKNKEQGFVYRSVDAVMAELHDIMAEEGLFVIPTVLETIDATRTTKSGAEWNHVKATIAYDFYATDGSTLRSIVRGEALDSGDKASNKALAIALKYVTTQAFMIPTEEPKDPDEHTPEEAVAKQTITQVKQPENGKDTAIKVLYGILSRKGLDPKVYVPKLAALKGKGSIGSCDVEVIMQLASEIRDKDQHEIDAMFASNTNIDEEFENFLKS